MTNKTQKMMQSGWWKMAMVSFGTLVVGIAMLTLFTGRSSVARADGTDQLVGKQVAVMFSSSPITRYGYTIVTMNGVIKSIHAKGFWMKSTKRDLGSNSSNYRATLFVPWNNVLYIKVM